MLDPALYSLTSYHTFGLTAHCQSLSAIDSVESAKKQFSHLDGQAYWLLGHGSNTVFIEDFDGTILLNQLRGIEVDENANEILLSVGAGESWHELVCFCMQRGFYGLENLALIPGTVGAAPIQNIGAYGVEVADFVQTVEFLDIDSGEVSQIAASECQFGYRDSVFKRDLANKVLISRVILSLPRNAEVVVSYGELAALANPDPQNIFKKVVEVRKNKLPDPKKLGNAGSFFKNPTISVNELIALKDRYSDIPYYLINDSTAKLPAAWLIDKLGFKGQAVGGIRCHPKQALVLTNTGDGTGKQLLRFAREIKQRVAESFDIQLENEARLVGNNGLVSL